MKYAELRQWGRDTNVGTPARLVWWDIAFHAGDKPDAWPSVSTIMAETGLSRRAVQHALRELEQADEIVRTPRRGHVSTYQLTPQRGAPRAQRTTDAAHESVKRGAPTRQKGRTTDAQKELKELKESARAKNGAAAPPKRAAAPTPNPGPVRTDDDGTTFLPGTGPVPLVTHRDEPVRAKLTREELRRRRAEATAHPKEN